MEQARQASILLSHGMVFKDSLPLPKGDTNKIDDFENPKAFEKEDCVSCRVLGTDPSRERKRVLRGNLIVPICRVNRLRRARGIHLFFRHAATPDATQGDRAQQIEIQIRLAAVGHRVSLGDAGRIGGLADV